MSTLPDVSVEPTLYWRVEKIDPSIQDQLAHIVKCLGDQPVPGVTLTLEREKTGIKVETSDDVWSLGYEPSIYGQLFPVSNEGAGSIPRKLGPIPVLILFKLDRERAGEFSFTDENANDVKSVIDESLSIFQDTTLSIIEIKELGGKLDLCIPPFFFSKIATGVTF